ncbi:glycosyltransferase family 2 protein [Paenibacillus xerothermodurans]|uniref:Glycosyltransferase n=1 Tax=Paenibacillus xerothermodurans TaxID=1977292 RepID=A0A2W1N8B1_PAEXE|nr:glycosyltransferase family 2 protein [Paenibacillus xerothermodurans]PZE20809.1 glycosyltransferase [Paenibacillus xerothermodurans]
MDRISDKVSIVIPAYKEGKHVFTSLQLISSHIASVCDEYEIVVVDDGSPDDTWEQLLLSTKVIRHLKIIRLSRNFGKELALCAGLENANGDAVIIMDADMQHPPHLIPQLIATWKTSNADIVECVKRKRGTETLKNKLGAKLFYGIISKLTGYKLEGASDFKLLDKKVLLAWSSMAERNTFFRGMVAWLGFQKEQIEFDVEERVEGSTSWSIFSLTKLAIQAVVSFSTFPLRIVSIIGVITFLASIILGIQTLHHKIIGSAVTGFTTVILLQLIIASIIMVSLGTLGEYIAAIYNEVKGRPRYLISQRVQHENAKVYSN